MMAAAFATSCRPGSNGLTHALDATAFLSNGARPAHNTDQLAMYGDLVYASPKLALTDIPRFFKDATFGAKAGEVESSVSPRADVSITRDRASAYHTSPLPRVPGPCSARATRRRRIGCF